MPDAHKNFAVSNVVTAPVSPTAGTSLTVVTGEGARFPATPFNATVCPANVIAIPTNAEIVRVTGIAGDVLTITRAVEGSTARSIQVGDQIFASVTAKTLTDAESPPNCRVSNSTNVVLTTGVERTLPFDTELMDASAMHDPVTNNDRITFAQAGIYLVGAHVVFDANATGYRAIYIRLNGLAGAAQATVVANPAASTNYGYQECITLVKAAAGDYVVATGFQNSGGNLNAMTLGIYSPAFWAVWQAAS